MGWDCSVRVNPLCLGGGMVGKSEVGASAPITLSLQVNPLFCPYTTTHQTCAGLRQMKHMRLNGFVQTALLGVCSYFIYE